MGVEIADYRYGDNKLRRIIRRTCNRTEFIPRGTLIQIVSDRKHQITENDVIKKPEPRSTRFPFKRARLCAVSSLEDIPEDEQPPIAKKPKVILALKCSTDAN